MARRPSLPGLLSGLRSRPRGVASDQIFVSGQGGHGGDLSAVHVGDAAGGDVGGTFPTSLTVPGLSGKQPLDATLTALAGHGTTSFGIAMLNLANAAALRAYAALGTVAVLDSDIDGTLAHNGDDRVATQKATKTYVDALIAASNAVVFKGVTDCSANPNYPAADAGHLYIVSVAGKIGGASGTTVEAGDMFICKTDGTASGTQAAVGANWNVIQTNLVGAVTGPASAASDNLPSFNGTGGNILKDSGAKSANVPSDGQKAALAGTDGTPSGTNKYLTDSDPRLDIVGVTLTEAMLSFHPLFHLPLGANLNDDSGNALNGTGGGGITAGGGAALTSDAVASTSFDGVDDRVGVPTAPWGDSGAGDFSARSFAGWAQRSSSSSVDTLFAGDAASAHPALLLASGGNDVTFDPDLSGGAAAITWPNAWPGNGVPAFWVLNVRQLSAPGALPGILECELFVNGTSRGVKTISQKYAASPGNFKIGARATSTDPFVGLMAHVAGYGASGSTPPLNAAAITWIATVGLGRYPERDWGLVSALPANPLYGDRCTYIASPDSADGIYWNLIYDGQGSFPWKVAGPGLFAETTTLETTVSATYANLSGGVTGPSVTLPLACIAEVEFEASTFNTGLNANTMSYAIAAAAAVDADSAQQNAPVASKALYLGRTRRKTFAAGDTLLCKYKTAAGTASFLNRSIKVTPLRVG